MCLCFTDPFLILKSGSRVRFVLKNFIFLFVIFVPSAETGNGSFCYDDPSCWPAVWGQLPNSQICQYGFLQSPINLERSKVKKVRKSVDLVLSKEYAFVHSPFYLTNTGSTVSLTLNLQETSLCLVKGNGFLPKEPYAFASLHFHWGPDDTVGSEHTIDGRSYPLELHMIHTQVGNPDQLAVFGMLFQISEYDNPALNAIVDNLGSVKSPGVPTMISPAYSINLTSFIPKKVKVFRYQGSLTTPTCDERVIWTVFDQIQPVSRRQVNAFRNLLSRNGKPLQRNYRPVQPTFTIKRKDVFYLKSIIPVVTRASG